MDLSQLSLFLLWCAAVNYGVLLLSFLGFVWARESMYRLHHRWFELSKNPFDGFVYGFFGLDKLAVWVLMLVPGIVLSGMR